VSPAPLVWIAPFVRSLPAIYRGIGLDSGEVLAAGEKVDGKLLDLRSVYENKVGT
jgi:hypothetical protein